MSVLRDSSTLRSIRAAWKQRLRQRGLKAERSGGRVKTIASIGFWLAALIFLTNRIFVTLCFSASYARAEQTTNYIIVMSCFGFLLASYLYAAVIRTRDAHILTNTPITDKLARRHTVRAVFPVVASAAVISFVMGWTAHAEMGNNTSATSWQWGIAGLVMAFVATCIGRVLVTFVPAFWMFTLPVLIPVGLFIEKLLSYSSWRSELAPTLLSYWPPAYPHSLINAKDGTGFPLLEAIAMIFLGLVFVWLTRRQLSRWGFVRGTWEFGEMPADEWDEYVEHDLATLETRDDAQPLLSRSWIERCIRAVLSPTQKELVQIFGIPSYTLQWYFSLILLVVGIAVFQSYPAHYFLAEIVNLLGIILMVLAGLFIFPFSPMLKALTCELNISLHTSARACAILPIQLKQVWGLRLREYLIRAIFALPILMIIAWASLNHHPFSNSHCLITCALPAAVWVLVWYFPLSLSLFLFSESRDGAPGILASIWSAAKVLSLLILGVVHLGALGLGAWILLENDSWPLISFCFVINVFSSSILVCFTRYYYRSMRHDMAWRTPVN